MRARDRVGRSWFTVAEVAKACGVCSVSVREWIKRGRLRAFQPYPLNPAWRVTADAFEAFLREHGQAYPKATVAIGQVRDYVSGEAETRLLGMRAK